MATYRAEYPPVILAIHQEQEAVNLVLTGTALAVHSDGDSVLVYGGAATAPPEAPTEPPVEPPVEPTEPPPPEPPSEMGVLNMNMNNSTDNIVPLQDKATTVETGDYLKIDSEYMTAIDVTDPNNLKVTRASCGSAIAAHTAGAAVSIYGTPPPQPQPPETPPTEMGVLNMDMNDSTDDIVALQDKATTVVDGSEILIDSEYMTVTDATDLNNLKVSRATYGSIAAHMVGAEVSIWGQAVKSAALKSAPPPQTKVATAKVAPPEPREETKKEEAKREREEERKEEDAQDRADAKKSAKKKSS